MVRELLAFPVLTGGLDAGSSGQAVRRGRGVVSREHYGEKNEGRAVGGSREVVA